MPDGVICSRQVKEDSTNFQHLLEPVLDECRDGCDLVAGTASTTKASLVDAEESLHS